MRYLLDVNVLVAWGWSDHVEHLRTVRWISSTKRQRDQVLTSAIPELGFVRISFQRTGGRVTIGETSKTLTGMLDSLDEAHGFLPDDQSSTHFAEWCHHASRTKDAHLLRLAASHGAKLATLDRGIPGAFLIPWRD